MAMLTDGVGVQILSVGASCCHVCVSGTNGMAFFPEKWYPMLQKNMEIVVANFDITWKDGTVAFLMNHDHTKIYLCTSESRGDFNWRNSSQDLVAGLRLFQRWDNLQC